MDSTPDLTVTEAAAEQIKLHAEKGGNAGMPFRIAARRGDDGMIEYNVGFDDVKPGDSVVESNGVEVLIDEKSAPFTKGMIVDFTSVDGQPEQFMFLNPNVKREDK